MKSNIANLSMQPSSPNILRKTSAMSDNIRVAKNSAFLYIRMLFLMAISFYTSRVLLNELGVVDYGIYDVVGGVVVLFTTLKGVFASATQRFLNYAMGKNNMESLNEIFNMSLIIHICISIVFLILAEGIGLWFLKNKLIISPDRLQAAIYVFHLSVVSTIIMIMTVPYDAVIIANQRMGFYAYSSILNGLMRLGVIFLFTYFGSDKLVMYALLLLIVSLLIRLINIFYCRYNFSECKYRFVWNQKLIKEMSSFAGWNFAGTFTFTITNQGINFLLNMFGGVVLNAARGIGYQVNSAISQFLSNVMIAVQPHAIQLYAKNKKEEYYKILFITSKVIVFIYLLVFFPLFFFTKEILYIWLRTIPDYTVEFVRSLLLYLLFRSFHNPIDLFFKTIGELKYYQITELIVLSLSLPLGYISLKLGFPAFSVFVIMATVELINFFAICMLAQKKYSFDARKWFFQLLIPVIIIVLGTVLVFYCLPNLLPFRMVYEMALLLVSYIASWYILTTNGERKVIYSLATKYYKSK